MTLILTLVTPFSVLQVSDRLVSRGHSAYDVHANKNVIFLARNALSVFGYTGLAYLDGVPTDHWIAEQIADDHFPQRFGMQIQTGRKVKISDLGMAIKRLSRRMTTELTRIGGEPAMFPRVVAAGLQWKKGRIRPLLAEVDDSALLPGLFSPNYVPRTDLRPRKDAHGRVEIPVWINDLPTGWLAADERDDLTRKVMSSGGIEGCERVFVDTIRMVAARSPSQVGGDCMSISFSNTADGLKLRVRHLPIIELRYRLEFGNSQPELPAAHTPWFVSGGLIQQPQVIFGPSEGEIAGIPIRIDAPPLPPRSPLSWASFSQPRKPDPYSPRKPDPDAPSPW